jgi:hypothetical protein
MARNPIIREPNRKVPADHDTPHGCYEGVVYIGHIVEDPDTGHEVEATEAVPCRKCGRS